MALNDNAGTQDTTAINSAAGGTTIDNDSGKIVEGPASVLDAINGELGYGGETKPADDVGAGAADGADKPVLGADGKPVTGTPTKGPDGKFIAAEDQRAADRTAQNELYNVPNGLSGESTRRFQALVGDNKRLAAEVDTFKATTAAHAETAEVVKGFQAVFEDAKCQPQQLDLAVSFIKSVNTGDWNAAAKIVSEQARYLSLAMGRPIDSADPLEGHADLQKEVAENQLTQTRAIEIARARVSAQAQQTSQQQQDRTQEETRRYNDAVQKGGNAVSAWVAKQAASIDWPAKEKLLMARVDWLAENVHPSLWVGMLEQLNETISQGGGTQAAPAAQRQQNQPLRANGGTGNAHAQPKSMLEAINQELGYAGN